MDGLPKILIIEDNPQLREIYSVMLQAAGYTVETASDGPRGLQQCMVYEPAIIFLDIMMPGMSGLEVLDALRAKPEYKAQNAKIVLLTNLGHDDRIEEAWQKKADGYVVKADINATDLIEVIHSLMEGKDTTSTTGDAPAGTGGASETTDNEMSELGITGPTTTTTPSSPPPQLSEDSPSPAQTTNSTFAPPASEQNPTVVQPPANPPAQP